MNGRVTKLFPIGIGVTLRLILLFVSIPVLGYYGGDAVRYTDIALHILRGDWHLQNFWYPPGYPLVVAAFYGVFKTLWPLSLFNIGVYIWFSLWLHRRLRSVVSPFWMSVILWFLALDPIWLSQTALIGADFLGAVCFGIVLVELYIREKLSTGSAVLLGLLCVTAVFLKTVYLWTPILLLGFFLQRRWGLKLMVVFLLSTYVPVGTYSLARLQATGSPAISGHDSSLFGRYIVGYIYVSQGKTPNIYIAMEMADKNRGNSPWGRFTAQNVADHLGVFLKLFFGSSLKTVFGNANVQFAYYFLGKEIQGPGIWNAIFQGKGLAALLDSQVLIWNLGMIFCILEKLGLLGLALLGFCRMYPSGQRLVATSLLLILAYFAFTPIVFGEPRYFLPATVAAMLLAPWVARSSLGRFLPS